MEVLVLARFEWLEAKVVDDQQGYSRECLELALDGAGGTELLKPCPDDWLTTYQVSTYVGKAGNEGKQCIERLSA